MKPAEVAVFRALLRAMRDVRSDTAHLPLSDAIQNGVVRRTEQSEAMADIQAAVCGFGSQGGRGEQLDVAGCFRRGQLSSYCPEAVVRSLGRLGIAPAPDRPEHNVAFPILRALNLLRRDLAALEASGAFSPLRRPPPEAGDDPVLYRIGQRLDHSRHGPCVVYGWEVRCDASEPRSIGELHELGPIVDNRLHYVGIDGGPPGGAGISRSQPYYRVLLADGSCRLCAQELLMEVRSREETTAVPIRGASFFFQAVDARRGWYVPKVALARRYPDDLSWRGRHPVVMKVFR